MGQYCITMEQTLCIAKWFEAEDDEAAEEIAAQIYEETDMEEFMSGDVEGDYALDSDDGRTILGWS